MTCSNKKYMSLMNKVLDDEATNVERRELFEHLALCDRCRRHFKELKQSTELLNHLSHPQLPNHFTKNVLERLPAEKRHAAREWMSRHPLLAATAICILPVSVAMFAARRQMLFQEKNNNDQLILLKMPGNRP
ncbi:transcriptional regulator [Sporolactobacillus sp. THM7-7]|nr:transcriptional regulator [Sporolactobacillus sp. THM7-7]